MVLLGCYSDGVCVIICCGLECQNLSRDQGKYLVDFFIINIRYDSKNKKIKIENLRWMEEHIFGCDK